MRGGLPRLSHAAYRRVPARDQEVAFVPYAAVTFSYADYERRVQARFSELGIRVRSVHRAADPAAMIRRAEAICVGGGNTFALAKRCRSRG